MAKSKKSNSKFFVAVLVLLVAVVAVMVPVLINNKRNATAETVVSCSVNPSLQFVVNQNNKVMNVVATNEDGEKIAFYANFEGMDIKDATKLFVEICVEANYIKADNNDVANGKKVTFTFSGNLEDYTALKNAVIKAANDYFDENGIIAGAVAQVKDDITEAITNLDANVKDLADKTKAELMDEYLKISNDIKDIALEKRDDFKKSYEDLYTLLTDKEKISSTLLSVYDTALTSVKGLISVLPNGAQIQQSLQPLFDIIKSQNIDELKTNLEKARKAVNDVELPDTVKDMINEVFDGVQNVLDQLVKAYEEAKAKFEEDYAKLVANLEEASKQIQNTIKTEFADRLEQYKNVLEQRQQYLEQHKQEVQNKIDEFRASIA